MIFSKRYVFVVLFLCAFPLVAQNSHNSPSSAVAGMERKLAHIENNASAHPPDQRPTILTQGEINAYMESDSIILPEGVKSVRFQEAPGVVTTTARVDFDEVKSGRSSFNPLLAVFSGTHDIVVIAHAHGAGGRGYVHIDSLSIDGVEVPYFVLQLFVDKYIQPKYPGLGLDSEFQLPDRIDTATMGDRAVIVTQK
jgi:hypothetical protein